MNWYIGQDIVAIRNHPMGFFKEGDLFEIKALAEGVCKCHAVMIHVGQITEGVTCGCKKCGVIAGYRGGPRWFGENSFTPLGLLVNISELTEILTEPAFS